MTRRARATAVVGIVAAGALGVVSSTQTWLIVTVVGAAGAELAVAGAAAVPVLAPVSLAMLALGLALSIAGLVLRYVFGALTIGAAALLAVAVGQVVFTRPVSAVASTVTASTGISGADAVEGLVTGIAATVWPAVTLAGAVVLAAGGVFTVITARRWRSTARRFRTDAPPDGAAIEAPRADDGAPAIADEAPAPLDAIDSWDDLSRGDDPTAAGGPR